MWLVVGSSLRQPVGYMVGLFALRKRARGLKKKKLCFSHIMVGHLWLQPGCSFSQKETGRSRRIYCCEAAIKWMLWMRQEASEVFVESLKVVSLYIKSKTKQNNPKSCIQRSH